MTSANSTKRWYRRALARKVAKQRATYKHHPVRGVMLRESFLHLGSVGSVLYVRCEDRVVLMHRDWV